MTRNQRLRLTSRLTTGGGREQNPFPDYIVGTSTLKIDHRIAERRTLAGSAIHTSKVIL